MISYDKKIIQQQSERMYWSAKVTQIAFPVVGALIGGSVGYKAFKIVGAVVGSAGVGYAGYRYGKASALQTKSEAQKALCQVQIEENTRPKE
ncbi:hypothetical protein [Candidatus Parabeggiatoa sp. HSG14]|uniref:hypothetical protein n=1 Tax=Candidatus Parabeggiatoa sp. HSG14 TaxID=3055593 RepID=UPI0025A84714|nr:hypothetical protein [Thiotrichales bacterium HSG14]